MDPDSPRPKFSFIYTCAHNKFWNIDFKLATCADETVFYEKLLDALKTSSKGKDNKTTLFISDDFYYQAKFWLGQEEGSFKSMSKKDIATSKQKQWTLQQGKFKTKIEELSSEQRKKLKTV